MGFADGFIRAHREGSAQKREQEDRKLEKMMLEQRLRQLKIDEQVRTRDLARQNFDLLQGMPANDLPGTVQQTGTSPAVAGGMGFAGSMQIPELEKQFTPVNIPGVDELGVPGVSVRPQSAEQVAGAEDARRLRELQMQQIVRMSEPYTLSPGSQRRVGTDIVAENPSNSPTPASPFAAAVQAEEARMQRKLTTNELFDLSKRLDQSQSRVDYNELRTELTRLQVEQLRQATANGALNPIQAGQASKLADDFTKSKQVDDFLQRRSSYQTVLSAAQDPSAAGDLSLIFAYMKMLDPGSVVREGEFANAQNTAGVPDRVRNAYNKAISGERLNPTQRQDFITQAQKIFEGSKKGFAAWKLIFDSRAKNQNIDPKMVTFELPDPEIGGAQVVEWVLDPATGKYVKKGGS